VYAEYWLTQTEFELKLRESADRGVYVDGASSPIIGNVDDLFRLLKIARNNQVADSHRCHTCVTITLDSRSIDATDIRTYRTSKLFFIDLAGSERPLPTARNSQPKSDPQQRVCSVPTATTFVVGYVVG
jgi:hypothetical protein